MHDAPPPPASPLPSDAAVRRPLPRLFIDSQRLGESCDSLELTGAPHHYLLRVLRLRTGDELLLLDGKGLLRGARISAATATGCTLALAPGRQLAQAAGPRITLLVGLLKGEKHDLVIQKATELGVARIATLLLKRCVPRLESGAGDDESRAGRRLQRWLRVAESAAQQCRRSALPEVTPALTLGAALVAATAAQPAPLRLLLHEGEAPPLASVVRAALEAESPPSAVELLVGPEGGLEPAEQEQALAQGFLPVSLGPQILRAETAVLAAIVAVQTAWSL